MRQSSKPFSPLDKALEEGWSGLQKPTPKFPIKERVRQHAGGRNTAIQPRKCLSKQLPVWGVLPDKCPDSVWHTRMQLFKVSQSLYLQERFVFQEAQQRTHGGQGDMLVIDHSQPESRTIQRKDGTRKSLTLPDAKRRPSASTKQELAN